MCSYIDVNEYNDFKSTLKKRYTLQEDVLAESFNNMDIFWDRPNGTVTIGLDGYQAECMLKLGYAPKAAAHTPGVYVRPTFGETVQYAKEEPKSRPLTKAEETFVNSATGMALWYAALIDGSMQVAISKIKQMPSTKLQLDATHRMLDYWSTYPNGRITFKKSDMHLKAFSDASFAGESKARSRLGGMMYFGNDNDSPLLTGPIFENGMIDQKSSIYSQVLRSTPEAEYGGVYDYAQRCSYARSICESMKIPQKTTPIWTDNDIARKLINNEAKQRRTKVMDRKWHWINQQVEQGIFSIHRESGKTIIADIMTKFFDVKTHQATIKRLMTFAEKEELRTNARTKRTAAASKTVPLSPSATTTSHIPQVRTTIVSSNKTKSQLDKAANVYLRGCIGVRH